LTLLDLSNNQLSGTIPSLATLTKLTTARLNSNQLTGQIPDLSALSSLGTLLLNTNQLTGTIPSFSALFGLQQVDLSNNQLSGTIPSLTNNTGLNKLIFHDNQLTGSIPPIAALTKLTTVHGNDSFADRLKQRGIDHFGQQSVVRKDPDGAESPDPERVEFMSKLPDRFRRLQLGHGYRCYPVEPELHVGASSGDQQRRRGGTEQCGEYYSARIVDFDLRLEPCPGPSRLE
jgi:hypothetical protein